MNDIILYSNNCPKCSIIKKKLDDKGIKYFEVNDEELMISKGFTHMPMLEINNEVMDFSAANAWINAQEAQNI